METRISAFREDLDDSQVKNIDTSVENEVTYHLKLWNEDSGTLKFHGVLNFKGENVDSLDYIYEEKAGENGDEHSLFKLESNSKGIVAEIIAKGLTFERG